MGWLEYVFDGSLMPHGMCLLWRYDLLFLHVGGDILTAISYAIIPAALVQLVRKREDLSFDRVFLMFAAFIFLCGITHVVNIVNVWSGFYFLEGSFKFATGVVSAMTAFMVWKLLPKALAVPSSQELLRKNEALMEAEEDLRRSNEQLEQRVQERTQALEMLSVTDALTGIANRRAGMQRLSEEFDRCRRYSESLSVLMVDLDNFKSVNDRHGHLAGDEVLIAASKVFGDTCRTVDTISRYGGEEFLILLPHTNLAEARIFAERVRTALEATRIHIGDRKTLQQTCSIGIAEFSSDTTEMELLGRADQALLEAKQNGRNRAVTAQSKFPQQANGRLLAPV